MNALDLVAAKCYNLRTAWQVGNLDGIGAATVIDGHYCALCMPRNPITLDLLGAPRPHDPEFRNWRRGRGVVLDRCLTGGCAHGVNDILESVGGEPYPRRCATTSASLAVRASYKDIIASHSGLQSTRSLVWAVDMADCFAMRAVMVG